MAAGARGRRPARRLPGQRRLRRRSGEVLPHHSPVAGGEAAGRRAGDGRPRDRAHRRGARLDGDPRADGGLDPPRPAAGQAALDPQGAPRRHDHPRPPQGAVARPARAAPRPSRAAAAADLARRGDRRRDGPPGFGPGRFPGPPPCPLPRPLAGAAGDRRPAAPARGHHLAARSRGQSPALGRRRHPRSGRRQPRRAPPGRRGGGARPRDLRPPAARSCCADGFRRRAQGDPRPAGRIAEAAVRPPARHRRGLERRRARSITCSAPPTASAPTPASITWRSLSRRGTSSPCCSSR